ncbi:carcinoembryonic antigen-related cell adhesion molecule 20 [Lampris incognitus]|uniref:carcinoembryonic antigen-related cell adhesion molecule 20 n=1 Tax=Lampris incognitus TaxID=2546036 RepID=UPI0024B4DC41|nr:carcinoembryonic antigen-related cell adhesion molecule 20 [Lampris incognitus]
MKLLKLKSLLLFLSAVGRCAGQDALPDGPVDAVLGKNVTFHTIVEATDKFLTISWTFNGGTDLVPVVTVAPGGMTFGDGYEGRVRVNNTTGVLILGPLKATDSGDYSVSMVNMKGATKTGETTLRVLEPVSDVVIKSDVPEAVEFNSTVVLTCTAKGSFLKFSWTNGTTPIVSDGKRLTVKSEDTASNLTVAAVLRTDLLGPIYCKATNKLEMETSAPFNLSVSYGPEDIAMTATPSAEVVRKGSNITMSCSARSSPPASFQWYNRDLMLKETGPKLVLSNVGEKQSGNYSCKAFNAKTQRYASSSVARVTVTEAISGTTVTGPTATLIAGIHAANLTCQAAKGTVVRKAWMKDNKPLSPSNHIVISEDQSVVMIKAVEKEDNGEFTCQLSNAVNTDTASYKMVVNYGPESVTVTGEDAVEVNDPVSIQCSAISIPAATFTWKFNGTASAVKTSVFAIDKAIYKHTGTYTCEAHNAVTGLSRSESLKLSVKEEGALAEGLSDGAIAGIVIGIIIALALAIGAVIYFRRKQAVTESPY